jgi:amino acid transporter
MRYTHEDMPRCFRVPFGAWLIPTIGTLLCILLLINTTKGTAIRFGVWMAVGNIVYFSYGFWHSKVRLQIQQNLYVSTNELVSTEEIIDTDTSKTNPGLETIEETVEETTDGQV